MSTIEEIDMIAREVTMNLKADSQVKFTRKLEEEIIPLLHLQKGFKDEITLVKSGGRKAVAISLWDSKENADMYNSTKYPEVIKDMTDVIEGTPKVETFEVSNSTWYKIAAPMAMAA
jgi:heme-degrading monooxygenase HmoA